MRKIFYYCVIFLFFFILIGCKTDQKQTDRGEKYFKIYEEILKINIDEDISKQKKDEKIKKIFEDKIITRKKFEKIGVELLEENPDEFNKRIKEINNKIFKTKK